jgi:hypothetical protein
VYTVTFSLPGFITVKREGIELTSSFTATVNGELRVGGLQETITVTGQSPVVDTQNIVQQKVISRELLESVPNSRSNFAALTPGASRSTDVGGSNGTDSGSTFTIHGGRGGDTRRLIDGMRWNSMEAANAGTGFYYDPTGAAEIAIQLGGNSAEYELGGVQVNLVPKAASNKPNGYFYAGYTLARKRIIRFCQSARPVSSLRNRLTRTKIRTSNTTKVAKATVSPVITPDCTRPLRRAARNDARAHIKNIGP